MGYFNISVGEGGAGMGRLLVSSRCVEQGRCGVRVGRGVAWAGGRGGVGVRGRVGMGAEMMGMIK